MERETAPPGGLSVLVMAGGSSSRMRGVYKLLLPLCGKPLVEWVLESACRLGSCIVATTSSKKHLLQPISFKWGARLMVTPGRGYSVDLRLALQSLHPPVLIVAGDLPFLTPAFLETLLRKAWGIKAGLITVRKCMLTGCEATGISLWRGGWDWANLDTPLQPPLLDIDRWEDYREASLYCNFIADKGGQGGMRIPSLDNSVP